jgi:hypothetical protein
MIKVKYIPPHRHFSKEESTKKAEPEKNEVRDTM